MATRAQDLWSLVQYRPQIDPRTLATAIDYQAGLKPLDDRTRLLIRDSVEALKRCWGNAAFQSWLVDCPERETIEAITKEEFERPGFPFLAERLMPTTDPEGIRQFLRELGVKLPRPARLAVGGSVALILAGYLTRHTDDLDVVDEVPEEVRTEHRLLDDLRQEYGLYLAHFQSHYLPRGWEQRLHTLEPFGNLQVALVDVYDIFVGKLFSRRKRDVSDLRALAPQLDHGVVLRRLQDAAGPLASDPDLRRQAEQNWYIVYGEALPSGV